MDKVTLRSEQNLRGYDLAWMQKYTQIAFGRFIRSVLGNTNTQVDGLVATEDSTPSLILNISEGRIYQLAPLDETQ